jgi:predicted ribonuclease YlaK
MDKGLIEILPLSFIRGLSIDNAIVIIDETQNLSPHVFKTIISRIGTDSKYIFLGDLEQIDLKKRETSCLGTILDIFQDSDIVGTV